MADVRVRRWLVVALAVLAGVSLAYELALIRILGFAHFAPFAAMIISLALLGYAASGALLATRGRPLGIRATAWVMAGGTIAMPVATELALRIPFNELALVWAPRQSLWLAALFLVLSIPFFLVSLVIGSVLIARPTQLGRLYGADLLGAGAGAIGAVLLLDQMYLAAVPGWLALLAGVAVLAYGIAMRDRWSCAAVVIPLLAAPLAIVDAELRLSEYKPLAQALTAGAEVTSQSTSALGVLTRVRNDRIPIRYAPGISLLAPAHPQPQTGVFLDAGQMTAIDAPTADPAYLLAMPGALPYELVEDARVLLLNPGAGLGVRQALAAGARRVTAVVVDPRLAPLLESEHVEVVTADPRHWLTAAERRWDIIVWDSTLAPARYAALGSEAHALTAEAIRTQLAHLAPGGLLALHVPLEVPPRGAMKLLATIGRVLPDSASLIGRLAVLRSWNTALVVVAAEPLAAAQVAQVRDFAGRLAFDVAWLPGIEPAEVNRRLQWERPWLYQGVQALLTDDRAFFAEYPFDVDPITDDRPWYDDHFRWSLLPRLLRQQEQGGLALLDSGYLLLALTVCLALVVGVPLVLIPAWRRRSGSMPAPALVYFAAIGLGFLAIEIAFIQKLHLLFGHPLQAIAVGLGGFLVFAGVGGMVAGSRRSVMPFALGIAVACVLYALLADPVTEVAVAWPDAGRWALGLALTAPIGFLLGVPFPIGLRRLAESDPAGAGLAWGINGWASVLSAPLATLLAMETGFRMVLVSAGLCYVAAWLASRSRRW